MLSSLKTSRLLLTSAVLLLSFGIPAGSLLRAACPEVKVFVATGSGSNKAEAKKNALKNVKKKVAAYKKKHPGCKVKIKI
jgi:ABC-type glycerol-3-phosphate transport system substrate-binding protein